MRLRYKQAAAHYNIPEGTLRSLVSTKRIPFVRVSPRLVLLDTEAVDAWLAERENLSADELGASLKAKSVTPKLKAKSVTP
jgi:excisionase family DNA binding protein